MTKNDRILLTHFITRPGMYIFQVDIRNIQSFITGYEIGRKNKCHFYELSKELMSTKYKIKYLSDGWLGQINRLSKKQSTSDIFTFKTIALEVILSGGIDNEMKKVLKPRIITLINRIEISGHSLYNEIWKDEWHSLVLINNKIFRQLWDNKEWIIMKSINKEVQANNLFSNEQSKIPSERMLYLKAKFDEANCT